MRYVIKYSQIEGEAMQSLYISRIRMKNFRNFKDVDVSLG